MKQLILMQMVMVMVANGNNFKSFMHNTKLLENTEADGDNGILKNATIAVPLKHLKVVSTTFLLVCFVC